MSEPVQRTLGTNRLRKRKGGTSRLRSAQARPPRSAPLTALFFDTLLCVGMRLPFTRIKISIGPVIAPIARLVPDAAVVPILSGPARGILWQVGSGMMNFWLGTYEREKIAEFA